MLSHHAILSRYVDVEDFVDISVPPTTEYVRFDIEKFGIDDARRLVQEAYRRPTEGHTERLLCTVSSAVTVEAQHALLKLLEEPPVTTKFVFVLPAGASLLPTLLSRFHEQAPTLAAADTPEFEEFLHASYRERLAVIETKLKAKDDNWQAAIDRGLHAYVEGARGTLPLAVLQELQLFLSFYRKRGASNKMLLEHLSITLPTRS
ncbi:MAG: hypothetical protein AAB388_01300 [Patescibacteria group bacterium]